MTKAIRRCPLCLKEADHFKTVACVACKRKLRVCQICAAVFTGCDKDCRAKHKEVMKNAFGSREIIKLRDGKTL